MHSFNNCARLWWVFEDPATETIAQTTLSWLTRQWPCHYFVSTVYGAPFVSKLMTVWYSCGVSYVRGFGLLTTKDNCREATLIGAYLSFLALQLLRRSVMASYCCKVTWLISIPGLPAWASHMCAALPHVIRDILSHDLLSNLLETRRLYHRLSEELLPEVMWM